ncbi:vitamin K epoxide reductase, partial [Candidatus Saccharibacteria bacterium]|nr:vitamin K epoxide reductase [Candidatus Saccharibacteria bacterium]
RRFMAAAQVGYTLGLLYALYLFSMSFFVIQALCPWCLLVTLTTILVWFAITRYNIREKNLYLPKSLQSKLTSFVKRDYDKLAMFSLIIFLILAIVVKYGDGIFV